MHMLAQKCNPSTARAADAMGLSKVAAYLHDRAALPDPEPESKRAEQAKAARKPFASGSDDEEDDGYGDDFEDGDGEGKEADSGAVSSRAAKKAEDRKLAAHMLGLEVAADGYVDGRQLSETPSKRDSVRVRSDIAKFQHELMEVVEAGGVGSVKAQAAMSLDGRRPKRVGEAHASSRYAAGHGQDNNLSSVSSTVIRQSVATSVMEAAHEQKIRRRLGLSEQASPDEVLARRASRDPRALRDNVVGGLVQRLLDAPLAADLASTTLESPPGKTKGSPAGKAKGKEQASGRERRGGTRRSSVAASSRPSSKGRQQAEDLEGAVGFAADSDRAGTASSGTRPGTSGSARPAHSRGSSRGGPRRRDSAARDGGRPARQSLVPRVSVRSSPSPAGIPRPAVSMGLTQRELLEGLLRSHGVQGDSLDRAVTAAVQGASGHLKGPGGGSGLEAEAQAEAARAAASASSSLQDPEAMAEAAAAEVLAGGASIPVAEARRLRRVLGIARFIADSGVSNTASVEGIDAILGASDDVVSRQALKEVGWAAKQAIEQRNRERADGMPQE